VLVFVLIKTRKMTLHPRAAALFDKQAFK